VFKLEAESRKLYLV